MTPLEEIFLGVALFHVTEKSLPVISSYLIKDSNDDTSRKRIEFLAVIILMSVLFLYIRRRA